MDYVVLQKGQQREAVGQGRMREGGGGGGSAVVPGRSGRKMRLPHTAFHLNPSEKSMFVKVDQWILETFSQWIHLKSSIILQMDPFENDVRLLRSSNDNFPNERVQRW